MTIEKQYEEQFLKFKTQTDKDLLECAISSGLSCGFFIESDNDLYDLFLNDRNEFDCLYMGLTHRYKKNTQNGLSDRRVEMALRVSLANTLIHKDRMRTNETYVSNLTYSHKQLASALVQFDSTTAQNPLAYLIDGENISDYMSIIKGEHLNQIGLSSKNGSKQFRQSRFFLYRFKVDTHLIDDIIIQAYHPTVWYLICSGTLLSYSHLFNKVKEYVKKFKVVPKNG